MREEPKLNEDLKKLAKDIYAHYKNEGFEHDKCVSMVFITEPFDKIPEIVELFN